MTSFFQPLFSVSIGVWISCFVLAVLGLFLTLFLIRRSTNKPREGEKKAETKTSVALQKTKNKFQNVFARYGYLPKDDLSRSFVSAIETMKYFVGGKHYRYRLPWFLVMGAEESGKTTLLKSLHLDLPVGSPFTASAGSMPACEWRFYDHGIVLDLRGDIVLRKDETSSKEETWHLLLDLLANHRSNRPLDGIVLTISCTELMSAQTSEGLIGRADYLYLKLWQAQRILGIRLPVYIVVTKCDAIAGFSSFCNEIPPETQEDIFGWSSPYPADVSFQPDWLEELFDDMKGQILRIQQEIFARGQVYNEREGIFVFPPEFQRLKRPISLYLQHLFKKSSYHDGFFLRGVYFCGDASFGATPFSAVEETFQGAVDNIYEEGGAAPPLLGQLLTTGAIDLISGAPSIYFSTKLFREKIFREQGIARPIRRYFLANAKSLKLIQIGGTALTVYGLFGLFQAYQDLQESKNNILPNLSKIRYIVQRSIADKDRVTTDRVFFEQQAQLVLNTLTGIHTNQLFSLFVPFSWISSLEYKLQQLLTVTYDRIILVALSRKLYAQVQLVIDGKLGSSFETSSLLETSGAKINPLSTSGFKSVKEYVDRLYDFQIVGMKLNSLPDSSSIDDLAFIVRKLFGYELPKEFYLNTEIYKKALAKTTLESFRFTTFVKPATAQLKTLYDSFLRASFNPEKLSPDLSTLVYALKRFSEGGKNYDTEQLYDLAQKISKVISLLNNPRVAWLSRDSFDPGREFEDFLGRIASCYFFGQSTADTMIRDSNLAFSQFKAILGTYRTSLTGPLFKMGKGAENFSSEALLKLQGLLNLLFSEPFMAEVTLMPIQTGIPSGTFPLWDYQKLTDAKKLLGNYTKFLNNKLTFFPETMWEILRLITVKGLRENTQTLIAKSQSFAPQGRDIVALSPEEALLPEVQNLRVVLAPLSALLTGLKSLGAGQVYGSLKKFLTNQCLNLLRKLDTILESEGPYKVRIDGFSQWGGEDSKGALYAFNVYSEDELKNYVDIQRERIRYLAKEFAEPAIQLLQQIVGVESTSFPTIYTKWDSILTQLGLYARGVKGNTLSLLQDFILVDLNEATLKNCGEVTQDDGAGTDPTDFFLRKREAIKKALGSRCSGVVEESSKRDYTELASAFNDKLSGKFPFVGDGEKGTIEASLADVQEFYQLFDEKEPLARELISGGDLSPTATTEAVKFLDDIAQLRPFFQPLVDQKPGEQPEALPFSLTFRTNQEREINGNQIIGWQIKMGDTVYGSHQSTIQGKWAYGLPISIQLRWALGSPVRPVAPKKPKNMTITPLTATFTYSGPWSILRLLKEQKAPAVDLSGAEEASAQTLKFDVPSAINPQNCSSCGDPTPNPPLAKNNKTVVFMGLSLEALQSFYFPPSAPVLPSSLGDDGGGEADGENSAEEEPASE